MKWCVALVLAAACGSSGPADGAEVFGRVCANCHGPEGRPNEMNIAKLGVRDLTSAEFRARVTPALVENQVRHGSKNHVMPSFEGAIHDDEIRAVAGYVASPEFVKH